MKVFMRVFISFAHEDAQFAAKPEEAWRSRHIEAWSSLDVPAGEPWRQSIDKEAARPTHCCSSLERDHL
jgi:hypothetical protein